MAIMLKNVRLSFPALFSAIAFESEEPKYGATFLLDKVKDKDQIVALRAVMSELLKEKLKVTSLPADKICVGDGNNKGYDGYNDQIYVRTSSKKRPTVVNRDRSPITEHDGIIYAGCYVNAFIELWAQDNKYGKRINAFVQGVQFVGPGEPFGSSFDVNEFPEIEPSADYSGLTHDGSLTPVPGSDVADADLPF